MKVRLTHQTTENDDIVSQQTFIVDTEIDINAHAQFFHNSYAKAVKANNVREQVKRTSL